MNRGELPSGSARLAASAGCPSARVEQVMLSDRKSRRVSSSRKFMSSPITKGNFWTSEIEFQSGVLDRDRRAEKSPAISHRMTCMRQIHGYTVPLDEAFESSVNMQ